MSKQSVQKKSTFREYAEAIVIALLLALFIRTFVVQAFKIPSGSMIQTLLVGDHILVNKFIFGPRVDVGSWVNVRLFPLKRPERGDVIVFLEPVERQKDFIKRVIALPGETIEIVGRQVLIDGAPLDESAYVYYDNPRMRRAMDHYGPLTVPAGYYFVMGDNRENSADSRVWGPVPFSLVKGDAFRIYWSWNGSERKVRWTRIGGAIR